MHCKRTLLSDFVLIPIAESGLSRLRYLEDATRM